MCIIERRAGVYMHKNILHWREPVRSLASRAGFVLAPDRQHRLSCRLLAAAAADDDDDLVAVVVAVAVYVSACGAACCRPSWARTAAAIPRTLLSSVPLLF